MRTICAIEDLGQRCNEHLVEASAQHYQDQVFRNAVEDKNVVDDFSIARSGETRNDAILPIVVVRFEKFLTWLHKVDFRRDINLIIETEVEAIHMQARNLNCIVNGRRVANGLVRTGSRLGILICAVTSCSLAVMLLTPL